MRTSAIISLGAISLAQAQFQAAAVIDNNAPGKTYVATLTPSYSDAYAISGSVQGVASEDGTGVDWTISVSGFDPSKGPFAYHIHDQPVAADGNCSSTKAHLDPTLRGEDPKCDSANPAECQVGDLAGKYGKITTASFSAQYHDDFTSTSAGDPAFFGNRSVTFHLPDKTRIACANFKLIKAGEGASSTGVIPYPPGGGAPYPTGTGVASGYPFPSGTGAGPYPTGSSGAPPSSPSGSGGVVPAGPSASSVVPGASGTDSDSPLATGAASSVKSGVACVVAVAGLIAFLI